MCNFIDFIALLKLEGDRREGEREREMPFLKRYVRLSSALDLACVQGYQGSAHPQVDASRYIHSRGEGQAIQLYVYMISAREKKSNKYLFIFSNFFIFLALLLKRSTAAGARITGRTSRIKEKQHQKNKYISPLCGKRTNDNVCSYVGLYLIEKETETEREEEEEEEK
eukprot:gene6985-4949_t